MGKPVADARNNFVTAEDIRTRLLDSMIERLETRSKRVEELSWDIQFYRSIGSWLFVGCLLVVFLILRYCVETVDVHQKDKDNGESRVVYRERQLARTSEEFQQRHKRDK